MFVWGEPDAGDFRCGICGSFLYSVVRDGKWVHVTLGSLVDAPSLLPDRLRRVTTSRGRRATSALSPTCSRLDRRG